jgi:hypothetical protein
MHRREEIALLRGRDGIRANDGSGRENSSEAKATEDAASGEATGAHAASAGAGMKDAALTGLSCLMA